MFMGTMVFEIAGGVGPTPLVEGVGTKGLGKGRVNQSEIRFLMFLWQHILEKVLMRKCALHVSHCDILLNQSQQILNYSWKL